MEDNNAVIEQSMHIFNYAMNHLDSMELKDQLFVIAQMIELSENFKPLYLKYAQQDETEKFIIKL